MYTQSNKCIDLIMKGTSFSIELGSIFAKMYKNITKHQELQEDIDKVEKLVRPPTPPEEPQKNFLNTLIGLGWAKR